MRLQTLLERIDYTLVRGGAADLDREIAALANDSRKAAEGSLFMAIRGAVADGHNFLPQVIAQGCRTVLIEKDAPLPDGLEWPADMVVIETPDTRLGMALMSAAWFGYPAESMPVIGITGTKGKTTTTYMVKSILENAGYKVGLIGTIEILYGDVQIHAEHTTPESFQLQAYLKDMKDAGCDMVVMEVSSQALMMHRTAGIPFEIGVFTNIEPDHIGPAEHTSFEHYLACKRLLFGQCRHGVFNADDEHLEDMLLGHTCTVETFGIENGKAMLRASNIRHIHEPGYLGVSFDVTGNLNLPVELDIPGKFSVYNALTAIAICRHFNISENDIQKALKGAHVKGRIEMVKVSDSFSLMIDYAHNAMALESLLTTLKDYHPKRLVCLFGCGGNRARARRFEMGEVSGNLADLTVITSDNPRFEEPQAIIDDIKTGIAKTEGEYVEIIDRREAIAWVIANGQPGDIIVLAGKGHEDYQEIKGQKYPMDERVIVEEILKNR
ncbi:MAG: UDP-N-acetylmuramoyl-L-alanyl-D-glutamate--2,6-diaminopimelate ligase [Lachnospiraceae bacterium]|nr:UDP-N-acetylmuramoyl-L-alanyl-D-glutamate--2,6-diaminopimelate ligase [Lachnospiraceae bacterium]